MNEPDLYRVRIGEDTYIGSAAEVLDFMRQAEGAPPGDRAAYMTAIAARVGERLVVGRIDTDSPAAFLESLAREGVLAVEVGAPPSSERVDPSDALGDEPLIGLGPDVDPDDVDLS